MHKPIEQRREDAASAFVRQPELRIESLVRSRHQEFGRRQGARVHVANPTTRRTPFTACSAMPASGTQERERLGAFHARLEVLADR